MYCGTSRIRGKGIIGRLFDQGKVCFGLGPWRLKVRCRWSLSHAKGIYEQGRWNLANLLRAPFRLPIDAILNMMLR